MSNKSRAAHGSTPIRLVHFSSLLERMDQISKAIARRAYEVFESDGRPPGRELDHWFRAESELLHPVHVEIAESDDSFSVRAEVPGFTADQLEVSVEPRRLTISGKRETRAEHKKGKTVYADRCADQIFRVLDLPTDVDANKVTAKLKEGALELEMPKAARVQKTRVASQSA